MKRRKMNFQVKFTNERQGQIVVIIARLVTNKAKL
jgi:hypothetical protein